jgi:DNA-binding MarR family transcriptional regulator
MNDPQNATAVTPESGSEEDATITLQLLNAVEANSKLTQRGVARDLGIALGLANAYLKRCVRKGFIKVQQVPANRYAYFLTPQGFSEKSRLTAEYLTVSFNFFRRARSDCTDVFRQCETRGWRRLVLAGAGDLSEIATLCANETTVDLLGVCDPDEPERNQAGLNVRCTLEAFGPFDAVVVTALRDPQETFDNLVGRIAPDRVMTPALLGISRKPPMLME